MKPLPIDQILPQLVHAVKDHPAVVLQAPPGAGKTTKVPLVLLETLPAPGKIVMLEPRRLAATNAARWMAHILGEEVGHTVGYTIRFERKVSASTRIEVVTEGVLTRRLQHDPQLSDVSLVIFDEFHERNLHTDLALAFCRDAQLGLRPDLKLLLMSATLDAGPIARLLDDAPLLTSEGRSHPVAIHYSNDEPTGRIAETMATAVHKALAETEGDILAFLPGAGEINRCLTLLGNLLAADLHPLYGDLPFVRQERAIVPGPRRKVVLATNIAETSLTIEGVRTVIDSGLCRQLRFDPATGLNRLVTTRISAASAIQRAGRAGRNAPGVCYRLWTKHAQTTLIPFTPPEIATSDLSSLALELALWGVKDPSALTWLNEPPAAALAEARYLLKLLGALDGNLLITPVGRKMALLPVHPRLARLIHAGQQKGHGALACDIAALLTERDVVSRQPADNPTVSDSDLLVRIDLLHAWRNAAHSRSDSFAVVDHLAGQLKKTIAAETAASPPTSDIVGLLLSLAYPDRIGQLREPGSPRYLLVNGQGGALSHRSSLRDAAYLVAVVMDGADRGDGHIHAASTVNVNVIRDEFSGDIGWVRTVSWDNRMQRVVAREEERFGALVLASRQTKASADEVTAAFLEGIAGGAGLAALNWSHKAEQFRHRVCFLARACPEADLPDLSSDHLLKTLSLWLGPYLTGITNLSQLKTVDLLAPLKNLLDYPLQRFVDEHAPIHITVPSGSSIALDYSQDESPILAVKLQELFGLAETPRVAKGRVAVVLHLLSPARRPIQVTRDLRNFWDSTYIEVKKELKGRYPKHPWPDDPWNAVATRKTKPRGQ